MWIEITKISLFFFMSLMVSSKKLEYDIDVHHSNSLIAWLKAKKGFFHPFLEMRRLDPKDASSMFGMFSTGDIKEGTLIIRIPERIIIRSPVTKPGFLNCGLAHTLVEELKKNGTSSYSPYLNYLIDTQPPGQLPSAWSNTGKEMFMKALGDENFTMNRAHVRLKRYKDLGERNTLPPTDPISWIDHEWHQECEGGDSDLEKYAALIVIQRAWDDLLIPVYDMMSHRNGKWLNTRTDGNGVHRGNVNVYASRDIKAGEQLYTSYNMCEDCDLRIDTYGTPDILRDYGFVENMPQTWIFEDLNLGFRIDEVEDEGDENSQYVLYEWINDNEPTEQDIKNLEAKLEYVKNRVQLIEDRSSWLDVPVNEWDTVLQYMQAMKLAIDIALDWYRQKVEMNACVLEGTCQVTLERYIDLDEEYVTKIEHFYQDKACDSQFKMFDDGTYISVDSFQSKYQTINYLYNHIDRDMCMDLDDTIQICDSYRPHYHEYMVHHTARYLPKDSVQRVLFVGGGDSMLLHEILKYPSLALVVGLELDQKVTRGCFKYQGTQPHFEDERVEWWFGDASKSLLMLPKDYFASFDLVLVDLSETVMSFTVSDELTVLETLTLLVKPGGIFVKNEVYFEQFRNIFPYTAQINWYDNPIVCAQVMVMGSRLVDFMPPIDGPVLIDHGIQNLLIPNLDDIDDKFELYHDYAFNATSINLCEAMKQKEHSEIQKRSPGIVLIAEVEDATGDLTDLPLKLRLLQAIEENGMEIKMSNFDQHDGNTIIYIIMKEGYVFARATAAKKYVGLDIHLWSKMDRHKSVMNALVAAVGGGISPVSSYRVIAGGMFGVDGWDKDESLRGPQYDVICGSHSSTSQLIQAHDVLPNEKDIDMAIEQGLKLIDRKGLRVAILVGNDHNYRDVIIRHTSTMSDFDSVFEVIVLNCPSITVFNRFSEDANQSLADCEKNLHDQIMTATERSLIDVIVIDSTADKLTASILMQLLSHLRISDVLSLDTIVVASVVNQQDEAWKKHLLLLMKDNIFDNDPKAAFVDILFVNSDGNSEFHALITSHGVENFTSHLNSTLVDFNSKASSPYLARIAWLHGGEWKFQENFRPSTMFTAKDYDLNDPLTQWLSQSQIGHQAIVQLQPDSAYEGIPIDINGDLLLKAINTAVRTLNLPGIIDSNIQKLCDLGDGCLFVAIFNVGSLSVLWDGRVHIDLNIFTYVEDVTMVDDFVDQFLALVPYFTTMLRDEQPRGIGRVVAYQRDIDGGELPFWARP